MLREADLPLRVIEGKAFLDFLGPQDEPWLRVVIGEMLRFEGRHARELAERLAEPLPCEAPYFKRRAASRVLWRLWRRERRSVVRPVVARAALFGAAAARAASAEQLLDEVARGLGVDAAALAESLLADIPSERIVRAPAPTPEALEVALRTNLAVAQALVMRASTVRLRLEGTVRPIVRLAKLRGLLCTVVASAAAGTAPELQISGPFSLFRHTLLYGRALAEILPHLAWCARFELQAAVAVYDRLVEITLASGDPIFPAQAPRPFDSKLEARFARDFGRLTPDWDLIREPEPVRAGNTLVFPDFLLRHRIFGARSVLLEIVGFWTPQYLQQKLARLREARLDRFILAIDEERVCAEGALPAGVPVLRFRRRVDATAVLRLAETLTVGD